MASVSYHAPRPMQQGRIIAALAASLMLGACGQTLTGGTDLLANANPPSGTRALPSPQQKMPAQASDEPSISDTAELQRATEYWGKKFSENSRDLEAALSYARNLKAMGEKRRALAVLQQVALFHGQSRELAGEYGRLALELDQVAAAKQLLAAADDPANPDWRVVSARGAVLAKEGKYEEAIPFFERAMALSNNQPSVMSNLALAYAMNGEPERAEGLLRQAAAKDDTTPRIRQNLALVLGLQGKYDEAKLIAARDMPMSKATENAEILRQVVKLEPKPVPNSDPQPVGEPWGADAKVAELPVAAAVPVQKVDDVRALPPVDQHAVHDTAWLVSTDEAALATAAPAHGNDSQVLSVSEMAARLSNEGARARASAPSAKSAPATVLSVSEMAAQLSGGGFAVDE